MTANRNTTTPSLELDDLLIELDFGLARLDRGHNRRLWSMVKTGTAPGPPSGPGSLAASGSAAHQAQWEKLLAGEDVAMRLDAAFRREGADRARRRRCALWLSLAAATEAKRQAKVESAMRQAGTMTDSFAAAVGRERLGVDALRATLARDRDRGRREQAYLALASLARSMAQLYRDTLQAHSAAWTPRAAAPGGAVAPRGDVAPGGAVAAPPRAGLWRQPLSPFVLEWQDVDVAAVADRILRETGPLLERFGHVAARAAGVRTLRAWDIGYAAWRLAEPYDRYFPAADMPTAIANGMRACGLPIDSLPLDLELSPRWLPLELSGWPERRWAVFPMQRSVAQAAGEPGPAGATRRLPRPEVGVAVDSRSGFGAAAVDLALATGAAAGIIHCRGGFLAEYRYGRRADVGSAVAGFIVAEPNWLAGQTTMPRSEIPGYLALGCQAAGLLRAIRLREAAARAKAVWLAVGGGGDGPDALEAGADLLGQAYGVPFEAGLGALDTATLADPAARPADLLSEVAAGQLAGYLRRDHGKLMGDRRTGECLIECFWRHGALAPQPAALELATGAGLDPGPEIDELLQAGGA